MSWQKQKIKHRNELDVASIESNLDDSYYDRLRVRENTLFGMYSLVIRVSLASLDIRMWEDARQ